MAAFSGFQTIHLLLDFTQLRVEFRFMETAHKDVTFPLNLLSLTYQSAQVTSLWKHLDYVLR